MMLVTRYAFIGFLLMTPLIYKIGLSPGANSMRNFQEDIFRLLGMSLVSLFIGNIYLSAFFIYNVILFVVNGGVIGESYVFNLFLGLMIFMASKTFFRSFLFDDLYKIVWLGVITLSFMCVQLLGIDPLYVPMHMDGSLNLHHVRTDLVGIFGIKAFNGIFFALLVPILASRNMWVALITFFPIYLMQSTGALVGAVCGLLFYMYHSGDRLSFTVPCIFIRGWIKIFSERLTIPRLEIHKQQYNVLWSAIFLAVLAPSVLFVAITKDFKADSLMFTSRFHIWHAGVKMTLRHPQGYGPDSWYKLTPHKDFLFVGNEGRDAGMLTRVEGDTFKFDYYHPNRVKQVDMNKNKPVDLTNLNHWDNPHSGYISVFFQYGFPGLILLFLFMRDIWKRFRQSNKTKELNVVTSMILVYFVTSLTQFPLELARTAYLFPVLLGAFYSKTIGENKWT